MEKPSFVLCMVFYPKANWLVRGFDPWLRRWILANTQLINRVFPFAGEI